MAFRVTGYLQVGSGPTRSTALMTADSSSGKPRLRRATARPRRPRSRKHRARTASARSRTSATVDRCASSSASRSSGKAGSREAAAGHRSFAPCSARRYPGALSVRRSGLKTAAVRRARSAGVTRRAARSDTRRRSRDSFAASFNKRFAELREEERHVRSKSCSPGPTLVTLREANAPRNPGPG